MNKLFFIVLLLGLQSCTVVDDYLLGKDNLPQPKPLSQINNKVKLTKKWSEKIGKSSNMRGYLKLKPVINKQILYTADASGKVQALNSFDGKVKWSTVISDGIVSGPSVGNGYVVVGTNASTIVVLKQLDGKIMWSGNLSGDSLSKAVISENKIIVKTIDGHLYAFDLKTGEQIWIMDHGTPNLILKASSAPLLVGNVVVVGFSDGKLDGVDLDSGRILWQKNMVYASGASDVERLVDIDADPMIRNNLIYLASYQGFVAAFSIENGQFIWNKSASVYKNMTMDQETLYYNDSNDVLWALDLHTGQVKWKQNIFKSRGLTEPVLLGSWLVVGDKTGYVHILSKSNGDVLARTLLSAPIDISPAISDNNIYVMTSNGEIHRLTVAA